jgi:hypothetical protein
MKKKLPLGEKLPLSNVKTGPENGIKTVAVYSTVDSRTTCQISMMKLFDRGIDLKSY